MTKKKEEEIKIVDGKRTNQKKSQTLCLQLPPSFEGGIKGDWGEAEGWGVRKSHTTHLQQKAISRTTASFKKQYTEIRGCSLAKAQEQTDKCLLKATSP